MLEKQINKESIDILHCSSRSANFVSGNRVRFPGKFKCDYPIIMTKIYYTVDDKIHKLDIHTGTINYNQYHIQDHIKNLISQNHDMSTLIKLDEILKEDISINTPMFKERILPYIRNQKINIINGN